MGILIITLFLTFSLSLTTSAKEEKKLPPLQIYPLPISLQNWTSDNQDNYFEQIKPHLVGSLIWTNFPVKVYLESPESNLSASALLEFEQWQKATQTAINIWHPYLSMMQIENETEADILIYFSQPEFKAKLNPETGLYDLPRIKAATTSIKFYVTKTNPSQLKHKMTIEVNPRQTYDYLVSNITHELGHALGIWGHSENPLDVMYYAHTQDIPSLSVRDINTLKKIYQQPTRLMSNE